jgi:2-C-methyl-D-erythritol 4-phosphate cytidylyltransferase
VTEARTAAVIVAGGTGERLGLTGGKQLAPVLGKPVLSWTLEAFEAAPQIDLIVVVCHPDRVDEYRRVAVEPLQLATPVRFAPGGDQRQDSVSSGLSQLPASVSTVVVHDGARPLVTARLIADALVALAASPDCDGLVVGYPAVDTLKVVAGNAIVRTPDRSKYWAVQTPQIFAADKLTAAHAAAKADGFVGTDDASLVERAGGGVVVFEGPRDNIKVTVAEDLFFVEAALRFREGGKR